MAKHQQIVEWLELVSETNWKKGRIIAEWMQQTGGDGETFAREVGGLTGQHALKLARVFTRFASVKADYSGLLWGHFNAAIDWDDAELWLEGAVQNEWAINIMRRERWQQLGSQ